MKRILYLLLLVACAEVSNAQQRPDSNFHLYLLIGQSNMAGRAQLDNNNDTIADVWMLDSTNRWVPAKDPLHFDKPAMAGVGPGMAFAAAMKQAHPSVKIGVIPCAWGGSPIKVWQPDSSYLGHQPYDEALERTRVAMKDGVLKGILWHQGESDNNERSAARYMNAFDSLVYSLRRQFNNDSLPVVLGEIGYFQEKNIINSYLRKIPAQLPFTSLVSAEGLSHKGDHIHFDTHSARELGKRYAAAMQALQQRKDEDTE